MYEELAGAGGKSHLVALPWKSHKISLPNQPIRILPMHAMFHTHSLPYLKGKEGGMFSDIFSGTKFGDSNDTGLSLL